MTIIRKVFQAFERLDINEVKLSDSLQENLSMDSQEVVSLIIELEKMFKVNLNLSDINRNMSVSDIVILVENKLIEFAPQSNLINSEAVRF